MEKSNIHHIIIAILAIGLVATSAILAYNMKQTPTVIDTGVSLPFEGKSTVSVSATSEVDTSADQAELRFRIDTEGLTAIDAQDDNTEASNSVMTALRALGVKNSEMESVQYRVNKKREYNPQTRKYEEKGFEVFHVIKVTTQDLDKVGEFADVAVNAGANGVDSIQFTLSEEKQKEVRAEALEQAGREAKEKAEALVSSLGESLGPVVSVSESEFRFTPYYAETRAYALGAVAEDAAFESPEIQPETLEIRATVAVVYEIK